MISKPVFPDSCVSHASSNTPHDSCHMLHTHNRSMYAPYGCSIAFRNADKSRSRIRSCASRSIYTAFCNDCNTAEYNSCPDFPIPNNCAAYEQSSTAFRIYHMLHKSIRSRCVPYGCSIVLCNAGRLNTHTRSCAFRRHGNLFHSAGRISKPASPDSCVCRASSSKQYSIPRTFRKSIRSRCVLYGCSIVHDNADTSSTRIRSCVSRSIYTAFCNDCNTAKYNSYLDFPIPNNCAAYEQSSTAFRTFRRKYTNIQRMYAQYGCSIALCNAGRLNTHNRSCAFHLPDMSIRSAGRISMLVFPDSCVSYASNSTPHNIFRTFRKNIRNRSVQCDCNTVFRSADRLNTRIRRNAIQLIYTAFCNAGNTVKYNSCPDSRNSCAGNAQSSTPFRTARRRHTSKRNRCALYDCSIALYNADKLNTRIRSCAFHRYGN